MAKRLDALADAVARIKLPNGKYYPHGGVINFFDIQANRGTDTVIVRAQLANPDGWLLDGQVVDVTVEVGHPRQALMIPQAALQLDRSGSYVLVVGPDDKVAQRRVSLGAVEGREIVIEKTIAIAGATVLPFNLPPIIGLGSTGGFQYELEAIGEQSPGELAATMRALIFAANQQPELASVFSTYNAETPQIYLDIDRDRAQILGVNVSDVFLALQATLGGYFVNQFNAHGRVWQVNIQAGAGDRSHIEDIYRINVSNAKGEMVPLRSLLQATPVVGPQQITRYNNLRAVTFNGAPAPGHSSGEALAAMERVSQQVLPPAYTFEWTGTALQEKQAAGQTGYILGVAVLFAYLFLSLSTKAGPCRLPFALRHDRARRSLAGALHRRIE